MIVFIPREEMTTMERVISELVGTVGCGKPGSWLHTNLPKILETVSQAYNRITEKGRS